MKYVSVLICLFLYSYYAQKSHAKYVFYLHGRIIEMQGINAVSDQFGPYEFSKIVDSLRANFTHVFADVRKSTTNFTQYSNHISFKIDSLVHQGIPPKNITVIGASKGGVMAMYISSLNSNPINYVLLGANTTTIETQNNWNLHGRILAVFEASDTLAGKHYDHWEKRSSNAIDFKQIQLHTGLGHGFFYKPIKAWFSPTKQWIQYNNTP